jgi:hypothetical protein
MPSSIGFLGACFKNQLCNKGTAGAPTQWVVRGPKKGGKNNGALAPEGLLFVSPIDLARIPRPLRPPHLLW